VQKYAFKMQLHPGQAEEYRRRHAAIWPELVTLLTDAGISDYSIHLDRETDILFAVLWRRADHRMHTLADDPLMRRWWDHMRDIMQTKPDGEPLATPLETVFHMP
jgi:L-rhamnose mutarotase